MVRSLKAKVPVVRFSERCGWEGSCSRAFCPRGFQSILEFAPAVSNITHKKRHEFLQLVSSESMAGVCKERLLKLRTSLCATCRSISKKSHEDPNTKLGACRKAWFHIKQELVEEGCIECGCTDGMTVEHSDPTVKMRNQKGQTVDLGDYHKWTTIGGPDAMKKERRKQGVVPMCLNCHMMQPTHLAMKERTNTNAFDSLNRSTDRSEYIRLWQAIERQKKQDYVNSLKLQVGKCEECEYYVVPRGSPWRPGQTGWPHAFQWAHRAEKNKEISIADIARSNISFCRAQSMIDKEIAKCRLLCMCCGKTETESRALNPGQ